MKENRIEDRINKAYCFLNSMHSDFRTGLYYKEDLENLEHILSDYKRVLKENEELKSDNLEYQRIQDIFDKRTYRKKYLEERRKEEHNLLYPDADEIYRRYYELQKENQLIYENFISKQKIKDMIDRIDYDIKKTKEIISNNSNIYTSDRRNDYQIVRLKAMNTKSLDIKKRLQELLESEKDK